MTSPVDNVGHTAVAPRGRIASYLTVGKSYAARPKTRDSFEIIDDQGDTIYCLWTRCAHLNGADWIKAAGGQV